MTIRQMVRAGHLLLVMLLMAGTGSSARAALQSISGPPEKPVSDSLRKALRPPADSTRFLPAETLWLIGDGSIQNAVGGDGQAPATGSVGLKHEATTTALNVMEQLRTRSLERFNAFYGFASSVDTVRGIDPSAFGSAIAPASVVGRKLSFFCDYTRLGQLRGPGTRMEQMFGVRVYGGVARMTMQVDSAGVDSGASSIAGDVTLYTGGVRLVLLPINKAHEKNGVTFAVETGPTFRVLNFKGAEGARLRAAATRGENHFIGWDVTATLQIRDLVATLYMPLFGPTGKSAGLTSSVPVVQVGLQTDLVELLSDTGAIITTKTK